MHHINIFECYFGATEVFFSFPHASIDLNDLLETTIQMKSYQIFPKNLEEKLKKKKFLLNIMREKIYSQIKLLGKMKRHILLFELIYLTQNYLVFFIIQKLKHVQFMMLDQKLVANPLAVDCNIDE